MASIKINAASPATTSINESGKLLQVNRLSYLFDGVNDFVSIPQTIMNFNYTDPQSYEFVFKMNSLVGVEKTLFSMFNASGFGTKAYVSNTNYINFTIRNGTPRILLRAQYSGLDPYIDQVLVINRWYHLIITYDGTDATKVLVAAGQLTGNNTFDNNIFLYEFTP